MRKRRGLWVSEVLGSRLEGSSALVSILLGLGLGLPCLEFFIHFQEEDQARNHTVLQDQDGRGGNSAEW